MSNRYLNSSPLPFETHGARTLFSEERPPVDVVEPAAAAGARLHPDRVVAARPRGFVAPTLFDVTGHDPSQYDDDDHHGDSTEPDDAADEGDRGGPDLQDYVVSRQQLLQRDHLEREACRADIERQRLERRSQRITRPRFRDGRRTAARSGKLDAVNERVNQPISQLRRRFKSGRESSSGGQRPELSTGDRRHHGRDVAHVATFANQLKRLVSPLQGIALALYFVLLPYVVVTKWHRTQRQNDGSLVRVLLIALALFWLVFLYQVGRDVWRLRRGGHAGTGGSAWLAGGLVALLSFFIPSSAGALSVTAPPHANLEHALQFSPTDHSASKSPLRHSVPMAPLVGLLPLALMAKRREDLIRQHQFVEINFDVDESIALLRALNPTLLGHLGQLIGDRRDGVLDVAREVEATNIQVDPLDAVGAYVACALGPSSRGTLVGFAREGGSLSILPTWSNRDVVDNAVALHHGKLIFADNENELLRALATRSVGSTLVIYLGDRAGVDEELKARAITLTPYSERPRVTATSSWSSAAPQPRLGDVRVELLRAEPYVAGLSEPLTPTLRRRGVEMLAYVRLVINTIKRFVAILVCITWLTNFSRRFQADRDLQS
jgi:hypothetical protein